MRVVGGKTKAFALPVVLITSLVMMIVLLIALASVTSSNLVLQDQYVQKITKEASESGVAFAMNCLALNDGVPTWTDAKPLTAGTDCTGTALAGCTTASVKAGCVVLTETGQYRTTFTVPKPVANTDGSYSINATGVTNLFRKSTVTATTGTVSRSSTKSNSAVNAYVTPPQLAGGGGYASDGHVGYYINQKGELYGWGDNTKKQIDNTANQIYSTPVLMNLPVAGAVKQVIASGHGATFVCIIASDNTAWCRGEPGAGGENGLIPTYTSGLWYQFKSASMTTFTSINANPQGDDNLCGIGTDGYIYCAGDNYLNYALSNKGLLGTSNQTTSPIAIGSALRFGGDTSTRTYAYVYNQDRLTCGLTVVTGGALYCEGINASGMLGRSNTTQPTGILPYTISGNTILDVITSFHSYQSQTMHVLAKNTTTGKTTIWGSGLNSNGELGTGNATQYSSRVRFGTRDDYTAMLSVGSGVTGDANASFCGISNNNGSPQLMCAGDNTYGQLGNGVSCATTPPNVKTPKLYQLPAGEYPKTVVTPQSRHMRDAVIVLTQSGHIFSAGDNTSGRFGVGPGPTNSYLTSCNSTPRMATYANGDPVVASSISTLDNGVTYFLSINGQAYAMGKDNVGQLGNGTPLTDSSYPVAVSIPRKTTTY